MRISRSGWRPRCGSWRSHDATTYSKMRLFLARAAFLALAALLLVPLHVVEAQARSDTTATDATARAAAAEATQAFWVSVGAAKGTIKGSKGGSLGAVIRVNFSSGPLLLTYRGSSMDRGLDAPDGVREDAFLVGVRSSNNRVFGGATLGVGSAVPSRDCSCEEPQPAQPREYGLAYDLTAHANARILGFAFGFGGVVGPARLSYNAFTVSVELGRFGRRAPRNRPSRSRGSIHRR